MTFSHLRHPIAAVCSLAALWMYIDRVCFSTLAKDIQLDLAFDDDWKAFALGAFFLAYAVCQVPTGSLADRFGPRKVLALCILGWSLAIAAHGLVAGVVGLIACRLLLGMAEAGAYPAAAGLVRNWAAPGERGRFSSAVAVGGRVGGAIAPKLTAVLAGGLLAWGVTAGVGEESGVHWRGVFVAFGACGVAVAGLFWVIARDRPADGRTEAAPPPPEPFWPRVAVLAGSRNLWLFGGVQFGTNVGWAPLVTLLPGYLSEQFGLTLAEVGEKQSTALLVGCVGMVLGGVLTDKLYRAIGPRWGRSGPITVAMIGCAVCCGLVSASPTVWGAILLLGGMAFLVDLSNPSIWSFAQDVGGRTVGMALGWGNMWGNLGAFASPILLTQVKKAFGWDAVFVATAVAFVAAAACGLLLDASRPLDRDEKEGL